MYISDSSLDALAGKLSCRLINVLDHQPERGSELGVDFITGLGKGRRLK